ncbi:uncharacterized protein LOC127737497 [Mytilus californianus]|uniref:uncharacterized protein LOC127737497 n=1 Tax=Mytilus californianus TaxID=6549 RepID=UPI002246B907|nr:uncharacterized protein LOC127737497 [Mytilus californianus]
MTTTETTTKTTTTLFDSSNRNISYHLHETLEGVRSDEALPLCNSLDMNIATIKSVLIYNSVKDYLGGIDMGSRCMWIGLYWKLETLRHEWEDGEPLTWAQWYNNNPSCMKPTNDIRCNGIERNCVSFTQAFNFRTKDCNGVCNVLCESNRSSTVITTSNNKLTSATPTEELSTTTELEVTKIITASPALKTLWTVGTWSYQYIQLDNEVVNWTQALQLCKGRNMDILMIKDAVITLVIGLVWYGTKTFKNTNG